VNMHGSVAALRHSLRKRRGTKLLLCAAGIIAIASTTMGGSLATAATQSHQAPTVTPTKDIVGTGLVTCTKATGEVGYSPASQTGATGNLTVSIWFKATGCSAAAGGASPVPTSVIGSMSVVTQNGCPLLSTIGTGTLNLAYNYPPVPNPMIDPSVAQTATVSDSGPYWVITGTVNAGSYPSTTFQAWLKPDVIAPGNCKSGITSEYIIRDQKPFIENI